MSVAACKPTAPIESRQVQRDDVEFSAMMLVPDGRSIEVKVVNLSTHGFMARTEMQFAAEAPVRITLPRAGGLDAQIVWSLGGRVGAHFTAPLEADRYAQMLGACPRPR